jgi:hypothetical protein
MSRRSWLSLVACFVALAGSTTRDTAVAAGESAAPVPPGHTLRLAEFTFDPLVQEPALPDGWSRSLAGSPDLHLVQFDGPIPGDALARMQAAGLEPIRYVYPNTYIVWGLGADRDTLRGAPGVRWTGDFAPAYRAAQPLRDRRGELLDVRVLIYRGAGADTVVAVLSRFGAPVGPRTVIDETLEIAGFQLPGEMVRFAAAIPGVYSIQPMTADWSARAEVSDQINVNNVDGNDFAVPGYRSWLTQVGLDGSGATVAIVDEGVDQSHPDLAAGYLPCVGGSCTNAPSIHGSHVAGIVTGDGASGTLDGNGFLRGLGVAPGAAYLEQEFIMFRYLAGGVFELVTDSKRSGATISNNSWGTSSAPLGYNADAMMIDAGVRDADPVAPGNQSLLYVQAIGNGGGGVSSQGAPDEVKNAVVVGSTWAADIDANPRNDIDSLSSNSAHGPALDGRRIPNLVAPGCQVDSTIPGLGGGYDFQLLCGTSMAAPQVSGAAALFTQYYRRLPGVTGDPSPALVKAALLAVARDLSGHLDADGTALGHRPDSKQGWGRLDLQALVTPPAGSVIYYDQVRTFEETGENWLREVTPVDPGQPMHIMLVWTDAPGHGLGGSTPAWNNDLDLVIDAGGNSYRGNVFAASGWSATGGLADNRNNTEAVHFAVPPGQVTIQVLATNINSDGIPNVGDRTDQDFALVCVNCAYASGFDLDPAPVTRDVCAPTAAEYSIAVESHKGFVDPVTLSVTGVPAGATSGFDVNPVVPGNRSLLSITPGAVADGNYTMTLRGVAGGLTRMHPLYMNLRRAVPAAASPSQPPAGAIGVAPQPVLEWTAVPWAASYVVEVSTDPTFGSVVYTGYSETTTHKVGEILAQGVTYTWRVRARNVCGFGAFSANSTFTTRDVPEVLLIDDDWDYWGDYQTEYRNAMDALPQSPYFYPVTYDVWDVYAARQGKEPDLSTLALYRKAIWWSGKEDYYAGPTAASELELNEWFVRSGGCLFLSSSDYVLTRDGISDFMRQQLGVASVVQDTGQTQVTGQGTVYGSLGTINLKNTNPDYSDSVSPDATAELAFLGANDRKAGIDKHGGYYRTSFLGFGAERLFSAADREKTLLKFLQWCDGLAGIDGDGDGVANGADCAPGDAGAWTAPSAVTDLRLSRGTTGFSWSQPVSGSGAVYDLLRSQQSIDFWNATCITSDLPQTSAPAAWDSDPRPGQAFFYLVRAHSPCGTAPMGTRSNGTPRQGTACK